ncbi:hypothetical protein GBZ26_05090, partial [Azospirillum formosense]
TRYLFFSRCATLTSTHPCISRVCSGEDNDAGQTPSRAPAPGRPPPPPGPAAPGSPPASDPAAPAPATEEEKDPAKAAEALVQRRNRGRAGTVQTSWRGALDVGALVPLRKRLLGE